MRLFYKHRLALWLTAATTSSTCLRAQAFSSAHKAFLPRSLSAFRTRHRHMMSATTANSEPDKNANMLRVALCQFKATEDKSLNHETCRKFMTRAINEGAQLIVLPVSAMIAYNVEPRSFSFCFSHALTPTGNLGVSVRYRRVSRLC